MTLKEATEFLQLRFGEIASIEPFLSSRIININSAANEDSRIYIYPDDLDGGKMFTGIGVSVPKSTPFFLVKECITIRVIAAGVASANFRIENFSLDQKLQGNVLPVNIYQPYKIDNTKILLNSTIEIGAHRQLQAIVAMAFSWTTNGTGSFNIEGNFDFNGYRAILR